MKDSRIPLLVQWAKGKTAPPFTLDISPTDWCNLKCRSCWMRDPVYGEEFHSEYQLSDERLLSLINEASQLGVRHVEITGGGEPLMRREVVLEMMRLIKEKGMEGSMTTNGTMFDEHSIRAIVDCGWDRITFSVDGADAKTNDWLRPFKAEESSPFERITEGLRMFQRIKKEKGVDKPKISFNVVLSKGNAHYLSNVIQLAAEHGVKAVNFEPMTIHSKLGKELRLFEQDVKAMQHEIKQAQRLADDSDMYTNVSRFVESALVTKKNEMSKVYEQDVPSKEGFAAIPCFEPWYHLVVKTDGSVGPCCVFEDKAVNVKTMGLKEIWKGQFFAKVRSAMESRQFLPWCEVCNAGQVLQNRGLRAELEQALESAVVVKG